MADAPMKEIKLFYCYAREDKPLRDELEKNLSWLKRRYHLTNWHDREILPGEEWEQAINKNLNTADLILLLISPDFMASDYCFSKEMQRALERHKAGACRVVPILLRPTFWEDAPFSSLQLLPTDAKAITRWHNRDEAFQDVTAEINRMIKDLLLSLKTKEEWDTEGNTLYQLKRYEEALNAFAQVIRLDPNFATAYIKKGNTLNELERYEDALTVFDQTIHLDPDSVNTYYGKGRALTELKRYEEALTAFGQAILLDPSSAYTYKGLGTALMGLERYEDALTVFDQAILLDPNYAEAYCNKGIALSILKRDEEALVAFDKAIRLDPDNSVYKLWVGLTSYSLKAKPMENSE